MQDDDGSLSEETQKAVRAQAEYQRLTKKPLQFGMEELISYSGHQGEVLDFIQNQNNHHNVTWSQKEMHFWGHNTGKKIGSLKIIDIAKTHTQITTIAFSHKWRLYLIVTADFKMHFLNELLKVVDQIDMSSIRLVNFAYFYDEADQLITAGIDGVFVFKFNYQGKYAPLLAAQIDQDGNHIKVKLEDKQPLEKMCIWVKGLKIDSKNDIIVSWNQGKMCFNHLSGTRAGKLIFMLKDLTPPETAITDVLINLDYRYFHTGTSTGQIFVWKYDTSKKQIHSFQGHFKAVSCLMPVKSEPDLLLSAALDSTVRIWSLDKFQQLYMLHLPTNGLSYIKLFQGGQRVLMGEGQRVTTNAVHLILKNYLAVDAEIEEVQTGFDSLSDYREHKVGFTISVCNDNSAFIQRVNDPHKCTLYPPPSAQKIAAVRHSISLNRVMVLLTNCSLCVYKVHRETALLEKILQQSELRDAEDKPVMLQQIISMELIRTESKDDIPPFDREILNERLHLAAVGDVWGEQDGLQEFLALGMSKGSIYLLHVRKLHQIYCRFTVHREAVKMVRYLPNSKTFCSVGSEQDFCLWKISKEERNSKLIRSFRLSYDIQKNIDMTEIKGKGPRQLQFFKVMDKTPKPSFIQEITEAGGEESIEVQGQKSYRDRIWLGFDSGDQECFEFDGESQTLYLVESEKQKEHEHQLTGIDYNRQLGLMLTSCEGGSIRIWNHEKKFLREIQFPHRVDSVCFFNAEGDILVSHEKRVSKVTYQRYKTKAFKFFAEPLEPVRFIEATDELFDELKAKDDQVRGKKVTRIIASSGGKLSDKDTSSIIESPLGLKQELSYDKKRVSKFVDYEENQQEEKRKEVKRSAADDFAAASVRGIGQAIEEIRQRRVREEEAEAAANKDVTDYELMKPYKRDALPALRRKIKPSKPIPGVSYLSTSGLYEDLTASRRPFQLGHMTRRNITEHRISSNIMNHNSPVAVQNFDSLNLGPQLPRHRRIGTTFATQGALIAGQSSDLLKKGAGHYIGYQSERSRGPINQYSPVKVESNHPFGNSINHQLLNSGTAPDELILKNRRALGPLAGTSIQTTTQAGSSLHGDHLRSGRSAIQWAEQQLASIAPTGLDTNGSSLNVQNLRTNASKIDGKDVKLHGKSIQSAKGPHDIDQSTMRNTSLQIPSNELNGGNSIESTMLAGLRQSSLVANHSNSHSPKLPILPRARHVYMQKRGLAGKDLSRNPLTLHTDRAKDEYGTQGLRGVSLGQVPKFETAVKKVPPQQHILKPQIRNNQNPFNAKKGDRPDSMISAGRAGSPEDPLMQNKFTHSVERVLHQ